MNTFSTLSPSTLSKTTFHAPKTTSVKHAWEDRGQGVHTRMTCVGKWLHALRVDARGGVVRVDRAIVVNGCWMPWEAVDGGVPVTSVTAGKKLAAKWLADSRARAALQGR